MESALDVLPTDSDLTTFLQSPQLQMAWYTQLTLTSGEKEATLFKEVIVSMQQSPELLQYTKEQLEIKKQRLKSSGSAGSARGAVGGRSQAAATQNIKHTAGGVASETSPYSSPPSSSNSHLNNVLMPSASSADTFYTLANAAARQHGQSTAKKDKAVAADPDPVVNEVWKSPDASATSPNLSEGAWGSMTSMDTASNSSPSIPLYKRRAGLGGETTVAHEDVDDCNDDDDGFFSHLLEPQPWSELATRSSTLPSSSLSSIWSHGHKTATALPSATSPINRTYANVLRHQTEEGSLHDPLFKIRQIGTRGSQELFESASTSPNTPFQQPFSPLNGKWQ